LMPCATGTTPPVGLAKSGVDGAGFAKSGLAKAGVDGAAGAALAKSGADMAANSAPMPMPKGDWLSTTVVPKSGSAGKAAMKVGLDGSPQGADLNPQSFSKAGGRKGDGAPAAPDEVQQIQAPRPKVPLPSQQFEMGTTSAGKSAVPTPKWAGPDVEEPKDWKPAQVPGKATGLMGVRPPPMQASDIDPEAMRGKGMTVAPPRFAPKDLFQPVPASKATASENRPKPKLPVPLGKAPRAVDDEASKGADGPTAMRILFIDELDMPNRPPVQPSLQDREVFVRKLPREMRDEETLCTWLQNDFGMIDHVFLLSEPDGMPNGMAYLRFQDHSAAANFVRMEGRMAAAWSESERLAQRSASVYGSDAYAAFFSMDGRPLPNIVSQSGVSKLMAHSETKPARGIQSPVVARQLHFFMEAGPQQYSSVKTTLTDALRTFHQQAGGYARARVQLRRGELPQPQAQSKGISAMRSRSWDPATGKYVEEELPAEVQEMMAQAAISSPPVKSAAMKRPGEVPAGGVPGGAPGGAAKKAGLLDVIDASKMKPDVLDAIERGEALVKEAQSLVAQGRLPQAKTKYRQGLRSLMNTMPDTPQDGSEMSATDKLHLQVISDYMSEMEALDTAGAGNGKGGARQQPNTTQGAKAMGGNDGFSGSPGSFKGSMRPATGAPLPGKALPLPRPPAVPAVSAAANTGTWEAAVFKGAAPPPSKAGGTGGYEVSMSKSGGCPSAAADGVDDNGARPRRKHGFT